MEEQDLEMFAHIRRAPFAKIEQEDGSIKVQEGICLLRTKLFGVEVTVVTSINEEGAGRPLAVLVNDGVFGMLDAPEGTTEGEG